MIDPSRPLDRFLMFLPGFLSWSMLLMPIWLGYFAPQAASFILTFLAVYWVYLAITHGYGLIKGFKRYKEEIKIDWNQKCKKLNFKKLPNPNTLPSKLKDLYHVILIPVYKEPFALIDSTLNALSKSNYNMQNVILTFGLEEAGEKEIQDTIAQIKKKYRNKFLDIYTFTHPKDIPGEIKGVATANRNWAARKTVKKLKKNSFNPDHFIFTTFDSDWRLHKEFIPRLTYEYLTDKKRFNRFYQGVVPLFTNNLWNVPLISRIESNNVTLGMISHWTSSHTYKESFSCYSTALHTLINADFWDTKFIDDTVFYWRAFLANNGDFSARHFYIPIYGDATGGDNYVTAHRNLYKQLVRWGWGSVTTVMALKAIITKKDIPLEDRLMWIYSKIERHMFLRTTVFLITFGFAIMTVTNITFKNTAIVYGLPQLMSIILSGGLLMFIPITYIRYQLYKEDIPKNWSLLRKFYFLLEGPLVGINLITYSFIPFMHAETMMMFGKLPTVTFYTPKTRK